MLPPLGVVPGPPLACWTVPRVTPKLPTASIPRAVTSSPCHAAADHCRPPPRLRRGWLAVAPQSSISRAQQHYKYPATRSPRSFAISPTPDPRTPPPLRPNAGELDAAVNPPLRRLSAHADPSICCASTSHNSPTPPPRPEHTGVPPPPFSSAADPPALVAPPLQATPTSIPGIYRSGLVNLPRPSTLAAGDHRCRIWPVKPAPFL